MYKNFEASQKSNHMRFQIICFFIKQELATNKPDTMLRSKNQQ